jgi:hypothetical protein
MRNAISEKKHHKLPEQIASAARDLDEDKIDQRMSVAATYIERGACALYRCQRIIVTDSLRELRDDIRQAASRCRLGTNNDKADEAVAQVRALRQQLEQLNNQQRARSRQSR